MPDITERQRGLRRARDSLREPGLTGMGFPVRYDNADPPDVRTPLPFHTHTHTHAHTHTHTHTLQAPA